MASRKIRCLAYSMMLVLCSNAHALTDLIVSSTAEIAYVSGRERFRQVSITGGASARYELVSGEERLLGINCDSFFLDASSSVLWEPRFSFEFAGTPSVEVVNEYGVTAGNGAGTYGGRGYNNFNTAKSPYGTTDSFEIRLGSDGTTGETIRIWYGGGYVIIDGARHGMGGGAIAIIGNDVVIDGTVCADGRSGYGEICGIPYPGYSGSGGGILIAGKNLTIASTARITANGGMYALEEGCVLPTTPYHQHPEVIGKRDGGGGRIKIFYEQAVISPDAVIEAKGYEDGTVYIQQVRSIDQLLNPGDLNGDGVTNHEDLFILQQSWQQELTPIPGPEETPTPTQ